MLRQPTGYAIALATVVGLATMILLGQKPPAALNRSQSHPVRPEPVTRSLMAEVATPGDVDQDAILEHKGSLEQLLKVLTKPEEERHWRTAVIRIGKLADASQVPAVFASLRTYLEVPGPFIVRDGLVLAVSPVKPVAVTPAAFEAKAEIPSVMGRMAGTLWAHELGHAAGLRDRTAYDVIVKYLEDGTTIEAWKHRVEWAPQAPDTPEIRDLMLVRSSLNGLALSCTPKARKIVAKFDPSGEELLSEAKERAERLLAICKQ